MKLFEGKNNEIRRVMRKYSLRVNRLKRVQYGPYTLELVPNPNDLQEVSITPEIRKLMYEYYKDRALQANEQLSQAKKEQVIKQN
jgi:23S rRNA pseudouridine2605 synthase